jgi:hypothetical protein
MSLDTAATFPAHDFSPPLEPDLARPRIADYLAYPGDFQIERVKRKERPAMLCRREQSTEEALLVARTNELLAMCEGVHGSRVTRGLDPRVHLSSQEDGLPGQARQ